MNKVILMGRLTKDPDIRYSQGEKSTAVARFSLAVDRKFKQEGQPTADFINCLAFGKRAEFIEKYCRKGTKLVVEGAGRPAAIQTRMEIRCIQMSALLKIVSLQKVRRLRRIASLQKDRRPTVQQGMVL